MARTIAEIKQVIIDNIAANNSLNSTLTSDSKISIFGLFAEIIAAAIWTLEKLFDLFKSDTEVLLATMKPHTKLWYRNKALEFQYGYSLLPDSDLYETIDATAKIVQFAAIGEETSILNIKVAKDESGSLAELTGSEIAAFTTYMNRVKDAGVNLRIISQEADHLRLVIEIHYDPLVLSETGTRLDGTNNTPAQDAITNYLENLPFDGEFSIMALTDALQAVEGIKITQILSAEAKWGTYEYNIIQAKYQPEAGWLKVYDGDLTINWIADGTDL